MPKNQRITKQQRRAIVAARKQRRFVEQDDRVMVNREIRRVTR